MDEQLKLAIEQLNNSIRELSGKIGRGLGGPSQSGATGGVNRAAADPNKNVDEFSKKLKVTSGALGELQKIARKNVDEQKAAGQRLTRGQKEWLEATGNAAEAAEDFSDATKAAAGKEKEAAGDRKKATKEVLESMQSFGKGLLFGTNNLGDSFKSLSGNLKYAADAAAYSKSSYANLFTVFSRLAAGFGYAIGAMNQFAENAQKMAGAVDLGAVRVGLLTSAKTFSALGDNFTKVINESQGAFRAFGASSEEAIENLSDLSRGLRTGSKFVRGSIGKEFAKDFDAAAMSTARLGLSQEEQASLQASIMVQVRTRAKNEREAQQMLVKSYVETTASARNLSNQFGISTKEIIKSMEDFKKSTAGRAAGRLGVEGAEQIKLMIQKLMPSLSEDQANRMALDMARGRFGEAMADVPAEMQESGRILVNAVQQAQGREGGVTKNLTDAMRDQIPALENLAASRQNLSAAALPGMFDPGVYAQDLVVAMREGDKNREKDTKERGKTEADNVKTTNDLSAAMDLLRGAVQSLTATILGVFGPIGVALAGFAIQSLFSKGGLGGPGGFGGLGAMFKEGFGKLIDVFRGGGGAIGSIGTIFKEGFGKLTTMFAEKGAMGGIGALLKEGFGKLTSVFSGGGAFGGLGSILKEGFSYIGTVFAEKGAIGGLGSLLKTGFEKLLLGIATLTKGGTGMLGSLGKMLGGVIGTGGAGGGIVAGAGTAAAGGATAATGAAAAAGTGILGAVAKYGSSLKAGSILGAAAKGAKGFGIGAVGGIIGDLAADALGRDTKAGAAADIAGTAASYAGTGAMLGSFIPGLGTAIGAGVGGLVGLGKGLWSNASTLFGSKDQKALDVNAQVGQKESTDDRVRTTETRDGKGGGTDLTQVMAYLSQISNDISAIRSNTRGEGVTAPVRLG